MKKKEIVSSSERDTFQFGIDLGELSQKGDIFALIGELGTGKTIIAKGIAAGVGVSEDITSPTYNLIEIYQDGRLPFYHFDLYRIESSVEFEQLYFEEYWEGDGISVIEWADRALDRFYGNIIFIRLEYMDEDKRRITIEYSDN